MRNRRSNGWEDDFVVYAEAQVEAVLEYAGVEVVDDTNTHFLCYCPFHNNSDSPAFAADKSSGQFHCFNQSCGVSGNDLSELLRLKMGLNPFQATRVINKYKHEHRVPLAERVREAMVKSDEFPSMSQAKVEDLANALWVSPGLAYMMGRGFTEDTLKYFQVGYSPGREYPPPYKSRPEMVVVPMHDIKGNPIGVIGRSIADKVFKNSKNLPKSLTCWNIHRAKLCGETVIVCESTFDAMRIHQAGYPNVVALLGGQASPEILQQLNKHFSRVVIMTDFDKKQYKSGCRACQTIKFDAWEPVKCIGHRPGRDLGRQLVRGMPTKKIMWATYDDTCVFPRDAKDAGDMTDDEIRQCLRNAISNLEYELWGYEESKAVA